MYNKAIWHRHWIDTVGGLIVAVPLTLIFCLGYLFQLRGRRFSQAVTERLSDSVIPDWDGLTAALTPQQQWQTFLAWERHADVTAWTSIVLIAFIWGSGIRSNNLTPRHPSIYFNLTLPVSRTRLVLTRFLMSVICAIVLMGILLLANSTAAFLLGIPVPFPAMLQTSLMGILLLSAGIAVYGLLALINENFAGLFIAVFFSIFLIRGHFPYDEDFLYPATAIGVLGLMLLIGLSLAGAVLTARRNEF